MKLFRTVYISFLVAFTSILVAFASLANAQQLSRIQSQVSHGARVQGTLPFILRLRPYSRMVFNDDKLHAFHGQLINKTDSALTVGFYRTQNLPFGWTSSVCFGTTCYPSSVDHRITVVKRGDSVDVILDVNNVITSNPDSLVTYLNIYADDSNPADSVLITLVSVFMPDNAVAANTSPATSSPTIQRIWPNPSGGQIHLEMNLPKAGICNLVVRSEAGEKVIDVNLGNLPAGLNSLVPSLGELPSGTYFIQVTSGAEISAPIKISLNR